MLSFHHPTTILISGPTQCGKTFFFNHILFDSLIQPPPTRIIYVYGIEPPSAAYNIQMLYPHIEFIKGIDGFLQLYNTIEPRERNLVVIDDQMSEAGKLESLEKLFIKGSHHRNITIVYIVQNLVDKGKAHRRSSAIFSNSSIPWHDSVYRISISGCYTKSTWLSSNGFSSKNPRRFTCKKQGV